MLIYDQSNYAITKRFQEVHRKDLKLIHCRKPKVEHSMNKAW